MSRAPKIEISAGLLRKLHRIHRQKSDLNGRIERGPRQVKAGETLVANAQAEVELARQAIKKAKLASDEKQLQLKSREMKIDEMKAKLNTAASNREFSTLKEQIAADEQANSVLSDEILEALEQLDTMEAEVAKLNEVLVKHQAEQEVRVVEIKKTISELTDELTRVKTELTESEQEIPSAAKADYIRLTEAKGEEALAPVDEDSCGGCYQTLTTNDISKLQLSVLIRCPNCNAFLYMPEDRAVK